MRDLLDAIDGTDMIKRVNGGGETAVKAEDLEKLVNTCPPVKKSITLDYR